jgi:hypothetical protein
MILQFGVGESVFSVFSFHFISVLNSLEHSVSVWGHLVHILSFRTRSLLAWLITIWQLFAASMYASNGPAVVSHPILQGKPNASHMCVRIIYTHMIDKTRVIPLL